MKRRIVKYVAGACVVGMVASAPGVALAAQGADSSVNPMANDVNVYRSDESEPSVLEWDSNDLPVLLYGPPAVFGYKLKNPMTVYVKEQVVSASRIKVKSKKFTKAIVVKKAAGKVTYKRIAKGTSKNLTVNSANGTVTVKAGTKPGRYQIKVRVTAKGDAEFYKSGYKVVVVKVRVKR